MAWSMRKSDKLHVDEYCLVYIVLNSKKINLAHEHRS